MSTKKVISNTSPLDGEVLEIESTAGSLKVPSMTTAQVNAIASGSPRPGIIVHDSDTDSFKGSVNAGTFAEFGGSGSGGGGKNYFSNPSFETLSGVTAYDDGGAYVDGAGGSASFVSASSETGSGVLAGTTTLRLNKATGDASGEGLTLTTTDIDPIDQGGVLYGSFAWDGTAANYPAGDIELFAYDVDGGEILPVELDGFEDKTLPKLTGTLRFKVFTKSTTVGAVRISFHIATDNITGNFYECFIDEFKLGPEERVTGMPYQDWTDDGAITLTGVSGNPSKGTIVRDNFYWRRVGDTFEGRIEYEQSAAGTDGTGAYLIELPNGYSIDTSKMTVTTDGEIRVGSGHFSEQGNGLSATTSDVTVIPYDSTHIAFAIPSVVSSNIRSDQGLWSNTVFGIGAAGTNFSLHFSVPIAGWQSNAVIGANQKTFRGSEINWTQVSGTPAAFGEYRALSRVVSSTTFTNDATAAPFTQADGWRIYSVNGTSAGTAGQPNRYEIYVGKNRTVLPVFHSSAGLTGHMLTDTTLVSTTDEVGLKWDYDPATGIALVTLPLSATSTTTRRVGSSVASGTAAANAQTNCYFDLIVSESPSNLFVEFTPWIDGGAITIGATTSAPTKGSSIVIDKLGYQINNNKLDASYQYAQSNNTAAASGSGTYLYSLPSGLQFDPTFVNADSSFADASIVGQGLAANNGTSVGTTCVARAYSSTQFFLDGDNGTTAISKVGSAYFPVADAAGHRIGVTLNCPVVRV